MEVLRFIILLAIVLAVFVLFQFLFKTFEVFDVSMEPTYTPGDLILVNKIAYVGNEPARGDVVAVYSPDSNARLPENPFLSANVFIFIKRIIAVGGDIVEIDDAKVYVNGTQLDEPYIAEPCGYTCARQTIPEGEYFVLGDDRNHSEDSHTGWLVPRDDIIGKVLFRYWHYEMPRTIKKTAGATR